MTATGHIGSIQISVMPDLDKFRKKLRVELERIEKTARLELTADINEIRVNQKAMEKARQSLEQKFNDMPIDLKKFQVDKKKAHETKQKIRKEFNGIESTVNVDADTAMARAKVAWLTRPRRIHVGTVFEDTGHVAEILGAITGLKMVDKTVLFFRDLAESIDKVSIATSGAYGVLGSLSALVVGATGGILNLGGSLARASKAGAALPALLTSTALGLSAVGMALIDTTDRLEDYGDKFKDLKNIVSNEFWGEAEKPIRHMLDTLLPKLREEYQGVAKESGSLFAGLARVIENSVTDGKLSRLFTATRDSIRESKKGVEDFAHAIIELGDHGAQYLPRLAKWFTKLGDRFNKFVTDATKDGRFDAWIEDGIEGLKDMGRVVQNLASSWKGLYGASKTLSGGMGGLADQTKRFSDMVNSPGFQQKLSVIFDGARDGVEGLRKGITDVGSALGNLAPQVGEFMRSTGEQFGKIMSAAALSLQSREVQEGLQRFHDGFISVTDKIADSFIVLEPLIGNVLGSFGKVADAVGGTLLSTLKLAQGFLNPVLQGLQKIPNAVLVAAASFAVLHRNQDFVVSKFKLMRNAVEVFQSQLALGRMEGVSGRMLALGAAAGTASVGIRQAGLALKSFVVTNAPVLALTAVAGVISAVAGASEEAAQQQQELKDTLNSVTGAVTEQTKVWVLTDPEVRKARDTYIQLGGTAEEFNKAMLGQKDALESVYRQMDMSKTHANPILELFKDWNGWLGLLNSGLESNGLKVAKVTEVLGKQKTALSESAKELRDASAQQRNLRSSTEEAVEQLSQQVKTADEAAAALRRFKGDAATMAEAEISVKHAQEDLNKALEAGGNMIDWSARKFDVMSESGEQGVKAFESYRQAMFDTAEAMKRNGASADEIVNRLRGLRESLINTVDPLHQNSDAVNELADKFGLLPERVAMLVTADTGSAVVALNDLMLSVDGATGVLKIDGNTVDAKSKLSEFISEIGSKSGTVKINGDDYPANMTLGKLLEKISKSESFTKINGDAKEAINEFLRFQNNVNNDKKTKAPVDADTSPARNTVVKEKQRVERDTFKPKVDLNTSPIPGTVEHLRQQVANSPAARMRVDADASPLQRFIWSWANRTVGTVYMAVQKFFTGWMADGGVIPGFGLRRFASGGEHHVAQIAPGGAYRLWAEPETGGEAYIPLAASKRKRSTAILSDVADRFGYGLTSYADGGVNASGSGGGVVYNVNCNIDAKDLRDLRDLSQFVDMLNLQMKMGVA